MPFLTSAQQYQSTEGKILNKMHNEYQCSTSTMSNYNCNCLPFSSSCTIRFGVPTAMWTIVLLKNFACSASWKRNKMTLIMQLHSVSAIHLTTKIALQYQYVKCSLWNVLQITLQSCSHHLWIRKFLCNSSQSNAVKLNCCTLSNNSGSHKFAWYLLRCWTLCRRLFVFSWTVNVDNEQWIQTEQ